MSSSAEFSWDGPPSSFVKGHESVIWDIIGSLRKGMSQCHLVAISSCMHYSDSVRCGNGSAETTVVEGVQNLVVGSWSCLSSIDYSGILLEE